MDRSDVSFSNDDAQPLISYCPALSACPANCSACGSSIGPYRGERSGLRAMSIVRSFGLTAAVVLALTASVVLTVVPAYAQLKWTLPSAYPADNFHTQNLEAFAKDVAQVTDGKLAIRVYPNASPFPASAIKSAVRVGQVQMGETLISLHDNESPIFGIDVVPFLATSYDEARKLWTASKPTIARDLAAQGLMVLICRTVAATGDLR
jgi:TRAP-type C4-dicarboxylate transport system substrate-binding protein